MKKILLALLASTAIGSTALAQEFPDVPAGSYAEEAVARLADLGIVIGFPDGTFRGNEAFTRYQAALVVTRLLDVVEGEMLTDVDLDTVRNALQELASDVAANEQAISDLQTAIASAGGADEQALEELQAQLDALTVELDTLNAAQAAAAGLEQQVLANTDQISQLTGLIGILNEDLQALGAAGNNVDTGFLEEIEQNTSDIANLREFVVLLRRDQVGVSERVATIEENDTAQNARLGDLETRVTTLEESQVTFGGSIGLEYRVGRLSGDEVPFDVDRIFGVGLERDEELLEESFSVFTDTFTITTEDLNDDEDAEDPNEVAQDRQDIVSETGNFAPILELNVDFSAERGLAPESGLNTFESTVTLELQEATVLNGDVDVADPTFDFTDPGNYFDGYVFQFGSITSTLGPIGAEPITFFYGDEPDAEFSAYVFESLGPGFRLDVGTPDFLAFLQPTLQIAYGVYQDFSGDDEDTLALPDNEAEILALNGTTPVPNPFTDAYYRGIRGTLTPFTGEGFSATGGFSVAQIAGNAAENADAADELEGGGVGPNAGIMVYGLDGQVNLSIFNLEFEYAQNQIDDGVYLQQGDAVLEGPVVGEEDEVPVDFDGTPIDGEGIPVVVEVEDSSVVYAVLTVDTEAAGIPLLESLEANYRSIPAFWYGLKEEETFPWNLDQTGFGAEATLGLSIFNLTGFVDSYSVAEPEEAINLDGEPVTGEDVMAYGVELGVEVFRAVEVFGFYTAATLDGIFVEDLGDAQRNDEYVAGLGIGLEHDGAAENALVPGLNFNVEYDFLSGSFAAANLDTRFVLGTFALSPYVEYTIDTSREPFSDDVTALEAGTAVVTEPLDVILQPSFVANVNFRNADHDDVEGLPTGYTATVLQYSVGVEFNQFLLENSSLGVRYGSFMGTNIEVEPNINGEDDFASDISEGDEPGTGTQTTTGYEIAWDYYGLEFAYGAYVNSNPDESPNPGDTGGQAFSIAYTVNF